MSMSKKLPLSRGQRITARVEEIFADGQLLLDIEGKLVRAKNESIYKYRPGDAVVLAVTNESPLQFAWVGSLKSFERLG